MMTLKPYSLATRLSALRGLIVSALLLCIALPSAAQNLPLTTPLLTSAKLQGQTRLRVVVLVYDAGLYVPAGFSAAKPYATPIALVVSPGRAFRAETVVRQLGKELALQTQLTPAQITQYTQQLAAVMPAMTEAEPLTAVHKPNIGWTLHHKGAQIGQWDDEAFSNAFFDIWLGEKTSQPDIRKALLKLGS